MLTFKLNLIECWVSVVPLTIQLYQYLFIQPQKQKIYHNDIATCKIDHNDIATYTHTHIELNGLYGRND